MFFIFDIVAIFAYLVGIRKLLGNLFYIVSFHWVLKLVIQYKQGKNMTSIMKGGLDDILDNDEEMAMQAIDSDNEIND
jgi:hypothetical protein